MTRLVSKTLSRTIRSTFGRYLAILAIVALGVGFFTGLKNAQPSMQTTADAYLTEQNMYDFRLLSSLGFTDDDVEAFGTLNGIKSAEGGYFLDVLTESADGNMPVYQLLSLPEKTALPKLTEGRMPQNKDECAADSSLFTEKDIGRKITLSPENSADTFAALSVNEFTIVGLVQSPRFISADRGGASVGNGEISGFLYLPKDSFCQEIYHEILLDAETDGMFFSDEYDDSISAITPKIQTALKERTKLRYENIKEEYIKNGIIPPESGESSLSEPSGYIFDLDGNSGCAAFKNDTLIVNGIANAFPVFFVIIAALVCITTMTRMVDEERTQIGTLKALGYSDLVISRKYILYASSAAFIGCVGGFFLGTGIIPQVIWSVYAVSYSFSALSYYFDPIMYVCCLAVSVLGSISVTVFACGKELHGKPSELIRPKPPADGGRIFLEHLTFIWKKMSFLWKATIRNAFRYKKRMIMMLIGISGCTALLVTGFGLKDSIENILGYQYDEIILYDVAVSFDGEEKTKQDIDSLLSDKHEQYEFAYQEKLTADSGKTKKEATVVAIPRETADIYINLHDKKGHIDYPFGNQAVVSSKLAEQLGLSVGGTVSLVFDGRSVNYTVTGICENYLNHYIYIPAESIPGYQSNTVYLRAAEGASLSQTPAKLRSMAGVLYVSITAEERSVMESTMSSINYIVLLVTLCAAVLAFIVLYNLTNINIMERVREVATVKVLGFHSGETSSYVLNENILLSVLGAFAGLGLGKLLHWYVIKQVQVDSMAFDVRINAQSYLISFACTVLFALSANFIMRFKLSKINMAESLKAVE